ncbi:hypothetical protein R3W88_004173 [Solanum pinnatisectum]|uniref:Zinc finger GRF-type domain-containing protein n=1 Tax=Solanum pinnatisectum TaxID=50273 RepID=A0AAV9K8J5_9SOLN|nr:hypothetical protein R3W88_004173 [Solanum pinnatisectum]
MSQDSSVSSRSTMKCQCGIVTRIFTAFTPANVGRRFYECSKPNTRMVDLEKYVASNIKENCERLDEIIVSKNEEVVVDNEEVVVDKSKKNVYKMWIVIAMLWCCFASFVTFWMMK